MPLNVENLNDLICTIPSPFQDLVITTNSQQVEIKSGKLLYGGAEVFVEANEPVRVTTSTDSFDVARGVVVLLFI